MLYIAIIFTLFAICVRYMYVVPAYKNTLVITTGRHMRLKRHGGAFVLPFVQKAYEIDMHPFYVNANDTYQADDGDIRINWTAAIAPDDKNLRYILDNGYTQVITEAQQIVQKWVKEVASWTKRDNIVMEMHAFGRQVEKHTCQELADKGLIFAAINFYDFSFQE